jgi:hypothetical protein
MNQKTTTPDQRKDASASAEPNADIARLEAEIEEFVAEKARVEAEIRRLFADEDAAAGRFHAAEIFAAQQDKLRIEVEIELRRKKINRLRLGMGEDGAPAGLIL